jgi:Raf kinase inhibitor-like YbhB/YbcL family protein
MHLASRAFNDGGPIPIDHTCDDDNVSPPLRWQDIPVGTRSLALICEDPDAPAGTWVHWVIFNVAAAVTELAEGVPATEALRGGARQGVNDFRRIGYGGPCPPPGKPHRYFFRLYALDCDLQLAPRPNRSVLLAAMAGHVLAEATLMGTYQCRR